MHRIARSKLRSRTWSQKLWFTGTQSTNLFGFPSFSIKHPQDNFSLQNVNWHPPKCKSAPSKKGLATSNLQFCIELHRNHPSPIYILEGVNLRFGGWNCLGGKCTRKNPPQIKKFTWTSFSEQFPFGSCLVLQGRGQNFARTFRKSSGKHGVFCLVFRDFGWVVGPLEIVLGVLYTKSGETQKGWYFGFPPLIEQSSVFCQGRLVEQRLARTILTEMMADEFNFSGRIQNYIAEAAADLIPIPGQLELHGRCRYGVLLSPCFGALYLSQI